MFSFWQAQGQHAISCAGLGTISIDGGRKCERLLELTGRKTAPVNGCTFRYLDFGLPLQAQRILLGCDLNILWLYAWNRNLQDEAFRCLKQVRSYATTSKLSQ